MIQDIRNYIPGIHKEGYLIILIFLIITLIFFRFSTIFGVIGVISTVWCICFFRDPERITPLGDSLIISPGDGLVQNISKAFPPTELKMPNEEMIRVSIFLSVFDVHVNRIPISGIIKEAHYRPGKFINASLDKASKDNERQSLFIKAKYKNTNIAVVQIAGLIARRIICDVNNGDEVVGGKRFGIIRFGSRVDVYIPKDVKLNVMIGQRSVGGETVIADLSKIGDNSDNLAINFEDDNINNNATENYDEDLNEKLNKNYKKPSINNDAKHNVKDNVKVKKVQYIENTKISKKKK